jgi:hypothetical protein
MIPPIGPAVKSLGMVGAPPMAHPSWISGGRGAAGAAGVKCFTPIGLDVYHLIDSTCGAGNAFFVAITFALLATSANAQNCQFYGNQTHCDNGLSAPLR